jgi:exosome complex RNA-binding protein Rrp4
MIDNDTTKVDVYNPTTAELKLLEILCNPEYATKNVTEICSAADVVRDVYYDAFKKDGFKLLIKQTSLDLVKSRLVQVVNATIDYAINNSRCATDRKTILQMADMVTDKLEHSGTIDLPQIIISK